jgi:hypothetical protein
MLNVIRRRLLAALPSMLLTPLPWSRATAPNAKAGLNNGSFHDGDYPQGCIFAKTRNLRSAFEGGLPTSSIDFWIFRVSEIKANDLPANIGKVVVWDDVFSSRRLHRQVGEIIEAVRKYYRFHVVVSSDTIGFHLENFSEIGPTIARMLSNISFVPSSVRIALIDIESSPS